VGRGGSDMKATARSVVGAFFWSCSRSHRCWSVSNREKLVRSRGRVAPRTFRWPFGPDRSGFEGRSKVLATCDGLSPKASRLRSERYVHSVHREKPETRKGGCSEVSRSKKRRLGVSGRPDAGGGLPWPGQAKGLHEAQAAAPRWHSARGPLRAAVRSAEPLAACSVTVQAPPGPILGV
jgi:hypothetical protein